MILISTLVFCRRLFRDNPHGDEVSDNTRNYTREENKDQHKKANDRRVKVQILTESAAYAAEFLFGSRAIQPLHNILLSKYVLLFSIRRNA